MISNAYSQPSQTAPRPRRLTALAFFTIGEAIFVSLDPAVGIVPAASAFLLGAMALTSDRR